MVSKNPVYDSDVQHLIDDLYQPGYISTAFSSLGIKTLIILSQVFRVDNSYLGGYLAQVLYKNKKIYKNKKVLDLGCGCGLLGLICAKYGAKQVHFSDINLSAVKNSHINSILLDTENTSFSCGNLFKNIPPKKKFDLIVFNPPNIKGKPSDTAKAALLREDNLILNFYRNFSKYLSKNGSILLPGSSRFDGDLSPLKMVNKYNLKLKTIDKEKEKDGNVKYVILVKR